MATSGTQKTLSLWTVYDHPSDYPTFYVARRFEIGEGSYTATHQVLFNVNLDRLRADIVLHGCYYRLERNAGDDPVIMEIWI